ncbi:MAG: SAM-dependent methyltransferase, partial [Paracoccaceae bacterium]
VTAFPETWGVHFPNADFVTEAEVLNFAGDDYNLIIHALSLHWSNDPVGQMIQCNRALREDGLFLAVLFGGRTLNELRSAIGDAEIEIKGGISPRVAPMAEIRDLGALLQRAGFALPVADNDVVNVTYSTPKDLLYDLRAMGEVNAMLERSKFTISRRFYEAILSGYMANFTNKMNTIDATFELIFLTGWAPGASQQKPLKPGSAVKRLADALGTNEQGSDH